MTMKNDCFRALAQIDLSAIRTNIINIKKNLNAQTKICCVIKADGYGHGSIEIAKSTSDLADFYAVATFFEALELKKADITPPVLVLGYVNPDFYAEAIKNNIRLTVYDIEDAKLISAIAHANNLTAYIHIKIDTGMSRIGFFPDSSTLNFIKEISRLPAIKIEGIFTHLFSSDSADKSSAYNQYEIFKDFCTRLENEGLYIPIKHCANSAAAISMPETDMDMARLGIAIYGLYPSDDVTSLKLIPALSLKSHVIMTKTIAKGTSVGYGATFTAKRNTRVATIPLGYADGYPRSLSNKGYVLINDCFAPVIGRICMDQFMVDVTDIGTVYKGSEAVLIGKDKENSITIEELSKLSGRFNYEFACGISKRVVRKYYLEGREINFSD